MYLGQLLEPSYRHVSLDALPPPWLLPVESHERALRDVQHLGRQLARRDLEVFDFQPGGVGVDDACARLVAVELAARAEPRVEIVARGIVSELLITREDHLFSHGLCLSEMVPIIMS